MRRDDRFDVIFERGRPWSFAFVVVADGLHSRVRELVFGEEHRFPQHLGHHLAGFTIPNHGCPRPHRPLLQRPGKAAGVHSARNNSEANALPLPPLCVSGRAVRALGRTVVELGRVINVLCIRRFALSLIVGMAAFGLLGAGSADAHGVACGDTVTHSVRLTADLVNCPANGLVIGRSGITVDLNGHLIDGVPLASMDGIDNPNGFDRVVIKNGTIREFDNGIEMVSSRLNTLRDLQLLNNANRGLNLFGFDDSTIKRVSISGSTEGAGLELAGTDSSDHNRVEHSSFRLNNGVGLAINGGSDNTVIDSAADHNAGNGILIAAVVGNDAIDNTVRRVTATNNSLSGVEVTGDGATNFARSNTVRDNEANLNAGQGILLSNGARDTTVRDNRARGNTNSGVLVDAGVENSTIRANTTNGNLINGVLVTLGATDTAVRSNRADLNGNDGLKLDASGTSVRDNRAESNTNLGIEALAGVLDGGGNHARLNGNALQCVGVLCSP